MADSSIISTRRKADTVDPPKLPNISMNGTSDALSQSADFVCSFAPFSSLATFPDYLHHVVQWGTTLNDAE